MQLAVYLLIWLGVAAFAPLQSVAAQDSPECTMVVSGESVQAALQRIGPTQSEVLARLVYAEGLATGFPDDALIYEGIAWGVMNRVRLGQASPSLKRRYGDGVAGVIFKKGQFNPAISPRSKFSKEFLCPQAPARWQMAVAAANKALDGSSNPFMGTACAWEERHALSLVVNFYYPQSSQARGPLPPWEGSQELELVENVTIGGRTLSTDRIRFYRLTRPPGDI